MVIWLPAILWVNSNQKMRKEENMELRLESFVQDTIKRKLDLYHVVVRQHGEIIGKFDWRENRREDIHSVSKSFLSIAIGIAIDEGILRLDENQLRYFLISFRKVHPKTYRQ